MAVKNSRKCPSELSSEQREFLSRYLPKPSGWGRKSIDRRRSFDAIFYVLCTACEWRMLPREFPCWSTVCGVFRKWQIAGIWRRIHVALVKWVRKRSGKKPTPFTAATNFSSGTFSIAMTFRLSSDLARPEIRKRRSHFSRYHELACRSKVRKQKTNF